MEIDYNEKHFTQPCPKYDCRKNSCKCGLKKVFLASALGDDSKDSPIAPKNGDYCNAIVVYEANGHMYIYSKEGIPTLITSGSGGGPTVVQTTGASTTDVMSQDAVTGMIYTNTGSAGDHIRIGNHAVAPNTVVGNIAIGALANANGENSVGIGYSSVASGAKSVTLGRGAIADKSFSVALGAGANPTASGEINVGTGSIYTTSGYNSSNYRLLTGLYDGQSAHDAATVGQLNSRVIGSLTAAPTTSTVGSVGSLVATVESGTGHLYICTDDTGGSYTWSQLV